VLDKRYLRENPEEARGRLAQRGSAYLEPLERLLELDPERRTVQTELDRLKQERNVSSKEIGTLMQSGQTAEAAERKVYVKTVNERIALSEARFTALDDEERELLLALPNLCDPSVPEGPEDAAVVVSHAGTPRSFDFEPFDHVELCRRLQLVNFEAGARVAGSGFPFLIGAGAQLQRALISYMLDLHIREHGYTEVRPPFLVRPDAPLGTGQLPKFGDQMYHVYAEAGEIAEAQVEDIRASYYLVPTAEVPVANLYREQLLEQPSLPIRLCAYSPCFRVEAGSYGKDVRGLTRLHQFEKVELIRFADPHTSFDDLEQMTGEAERVLASLGLSTRRKLLPTGDMAFASAKTFDIEVYAPAAQQWLEVSSASNTTDFQSRRMNLRFRREAGGKPEFPHILNASGVALPRLMIALLETYQTVDGSVHLPDVLRPYFGADGVIAVPPAGAVPFV
jgi:seryl-tRNA synthetase